MYFVSFIVLITIFFAYADDRKLIKNGYWISFGILTISMSLRFGYGNDYFNYMEIFNKVNSYPNFYSAYDNLGVEPGWVLLSRLLKPFGFQMQIFIVGYLIYFIYYRLINRYVTRPYRWIGIALFLLNAKLFLLNLTMLRQGLAGTFLFYSIILAIENKKIKSVILFLLAISVHTSAFIGVPFIMAIILQKFIKPEYLIYLSVLIAIGLFINPEIGDYFFIFLLDSNEISDMYGKYIVSPNEGSSGTGIGVMIQYIAIIPSLVYYKYLKIEDKYFAVLYIMILLLIPLTKYAVMLFRIFSYFLPFTVLLFPRLYDRKMNNIEMKFNKSKTRCWLLSTKITILLYFVYVSYSYYDFLMSATYSDAFREFRFFFL